MYSVAVKQIDYVYFGFLQSYFIYLFFTLLLTSCVLVT